MREELTVSLIQADLFWEEINANLAMFEEYIWNIESTDLIILPEMFTTGFSMNAPTLAEPPGGKTFKWMRQMAMQKKAALIGSYIIKEKEKYFNRLYFVYPDGSAVQYDKKHLFTLAGEHKEYTAGTDRSIIIYDDWRIHPLICYDLRFPVWSRSQKQPDTVYEYDLLLYVANWPDTRINAWDALLKARAIENIAFCVGVNRIGKDGELKNYTGHSSVYSYSGDQLAFSQNQSEILSLTLKASDLQKFRNRFSFQKDADNFTLF
ncbi:MAG: amidohydrolase [Bacteroidota bacterium]